MDNCKSEKIISGIKCDVVNCAYHHEGNTCHAGCIEVGHGACKTSNETACNTFRSKL